MKTLDIDIDTLREALTYDPDTGVFTRRLSLSPRWPVGEVVGGLNKRGYVNVRLAGVMFLAHRLAYAYVHGALPAGAQIDHVNGDKTNNSIRNLRLATASQNKQNIHKNCQNNTTGVRGVSPRRGRYRVQICVDGKRIHLGYRRTLTEAAALRTDAERNLHPFSPLHA